MDNIHYTIKDRAVTKSQHPTSATSQAFINNDTALSGSFCSTILWNTST